MGELFELTLVMAKKLVLKVTEMIHEDLDNMNEKTSAENKFPRTQIFKS